MHNSAQVVKFNEISALISSYRYNLNVIKKVVEMSSGAEFMSSAMYFERGYKNKNQSSYVSVKDIFDFDEAVKVLNAEHWRRALDLTDVLEYMPATKRSEWEMQIQDLNCPEFSEENVTNTLMGLVSKRMEFLAERVDNIFKGLSGRHVTNCPAGFRSKMIFNEPSSSYFRHRDLIHDLRYVIAKIRNTETPIFRYTDILLTQLRQNPGSSFQIDGGAISIKMFKKGTVHLVVHDEVAWSLNKILASLHPQAIPSAHRTPPKTKVGIKPLSNDFLPDAICIGLANLEHALMKSDSAILKYVSNPKTCRIRTGANYSKSVVDAIEDIIQSFGGVRVKQNSYEYFAFDFDPIPLFRHIAAVGCVANYKSYQFYPTKHIIAEKLIEIAGIENGLSYLEPSAGRGGIADLLPVNSTTCVEIAKENCIILEGKGFKIIQDDFLHWASKCQISFDRIVMNPPFDKNQWIFHVRAAAKLLAYNGLVVAIIPAASIDRLRLIDDFVVEEVQTLENAFDNTDVRTKIIKILRK